MNLPFYDEIRAEVYDDGWKLIPKKKLMIQNLESFHP